MTQTPMYSQLAARWQAIPRAGQWVLISALVSLAVFGVWQWQRSQETRYVPLLDGAELTTSESQRIKMAFAKANLNDFQSRGNNIYVPQHRWAAYSQSLLEYDALPEKLKSGGLPAPQVNVLATKRQQEQLELHQRKQNLRDMIVRLPFVESAIVDLDVIEPGGHYQPRQFTCIISIQPRSGQILHDDEVESIRKIVMGAVAGAAPERIYVTDLNCGITHDPQWTSGDVSTDSARWRLLQAKHELQEKIQNQLSVYGPIELAVRVGSYPTAES
ncbi:MAG TPA: hypothetical protein PKD54_01595, partial [Pirellulaceae bacterium]|nr:hypothetical protein [Pirellulaceae bacterium]